MMSNPNNLFPDETSGAQPTEENSPMSELPGSPSLQQQSTYSPTPPVSESPTESFDVEEISVTGQEEALTIRYAIGRLSDFLLWFLIVLEVTLAIEFFLMLIGADPNNLFTGLIYALTAIPLYPFNGLVPGTKLGNSGAVIEWSTLIAMAVYFLVFYALRRFLYILISRPEVSPGVNIVDATVIRSAINNPSYSNYQQLAKAIINRIGATDERVIESSSLLGNKVWEIVLPKIGLRLNTGKAILFLREIAQNNTYFNHLLEIQSATGADFLLLIDYLNIDQPTPPIDSGIVWLKPENLKEIVDTPRNEVKAWLGRLIASQVKNFEDLIPYHTEGSAEIFFGRKYEIERLSRGTARGGVIVGANRSGKSSLLARLSENLKNQNYVVVGPYTIHGENPIQTFFEDTLHKLDITISAGVVSLENWATELRTTSEKGKRLVLFLDEVDALITEDARTGNNLGREMRALQNDDHCKFYLAGHDVLRKATALEGGPFRNFAEEFTLQGLEEDAAIRLIREPIGDIGFNVSMRQAQRIFEGTAGVAVLIQDFCKRLLLTVKSSRESDIEDAAIKKVEESPDYLSWVYDYYKYAQTWDSLAITVITERLNQATRVDISQQFSNYGVTLTWDQLDDLLSFLLKFGVLKEFEAGHFKVLSKYLCRAIEARSPKSNAFLVSLFEEGKGSNRV